jgi:hypothetical protein
MIYSRNRALKPTLSDNTEVAMKQYLISYEAGKYFYNMVVGENELPKNKDEIERWEIGKAKMQHVISVTIIAISPLG